MDDQSISGIIFYFPSFRLNSFVDNPLEFFVFLHYYLTFPLKYCIYWTVIDIRKPENESRSLLCFITACCWLSVLCYGLIRILSLLEIVFHISSSIMAMTILAWTVSYPSLWTSIVLARNGFTEMAICNVIGSNIFSNCIGLGLPWLIYSLIASSASKRVPDQVTTLGMELMILILVSSYCLVAFNGFVLSSW